ncbi:ribonuclease H-like domain-containing protein [Tanacetum coccineum]
MTDYSLWEVIPNGNKVLKRKVGEVGQEYEPTTAEEKQDRRNEMKARGTLLMALPNKDQLKFHSYKDAKLLMEAIKKSMEVTRNPRKFRGTYSKQYMEKLLGSSQKTMDQLLIEQIDPDDLEEMDLQWEMAMLAIRARRFIKRTGRQAPRNQDNRGKENSKRTMTIESHAENALVAQDGIGGCKLKATLKEQYDNLNSDYNKSQFNLVSYKAGLELIEARLAHYKKNEAVFEESINVLKLEVRLRDNALVENKKKLEKAEKERDELKLTLEKFQNSSKSLNNLLESQVSDKFKTGLGYNAATAASPAVESFVNSSEMLENQEYNKSRGYHAVPPPYTRNFIPCKPEYRIIDEIVESENIGDVTNVRYNYFVILHYVYDKKVIRTSVEQLKTGKINIVGAKVNTAIRPVNTAGSKPTVNHPRSISIAYKKGYSQVKRPFNKFSANKNNIFNKKVNTVRVKDTTARDRAVVSENKGKGANAVKALACLGNPHQKEYKEKGVIDSGCSRHMTGNKCYLTEYEDYDGGFVSFGEYIRRGTIDKNLFIKKDKGDILLVQVYVDDFIFGSTKKSLCDDFEGLMHKRFQMSSMGELTFFLGYTIDFHLHDVKGFLRYLKGQSKIGPLAKHIENLGRSIEDLDANVEVPLVDKSQRRQDEDLMFDTGVIDSDEMFVDATTGKKEEQSTKVDAMEVSTAEPSGRGSTSRVGGYNKKNGLDQGSTTIAITEKWNEVQAKMEADMELAQRLQSKEQEQYTDEEKAKLFMELLEKKWKFFARKREIEKRNRPPTKAQQTNLMCTYLKNMDGWKLKSLKNKSYSEFQKLFDSGYEKGKYFCGYDYKDSGEKKVDEQVEDEKGDDQEEMKKHIEIVVEEEIAIDAIPLATKPLGIDRERLGKLLESWSQNSMVIQGLMMNMKVFCEVYISAVKLNLVLTAGMVQEVNISIPLLVIVKDKGKGKMEESEDEQSKRTKLQQEQERLGHEEEWENIRARVKADEELSKRLQAEERNKYSEVDQAKMLVDLINERKKYFVVQKAKAKRNKPMIQAQQRNYMTNYIKHMGSHTLQQLKRYSFDKLKELFETTMKNVNAFIPIETKDRGGASELAAGSSQATITDSVEVGSSKRVVEVEPDHEGSKKQKTNEASGLVQEQPEKDEKELSQEDLQQMMIVVPVEEVYVGNHTKVYQFFEDMLKVFNMDDLVMLWSLVKERFSSAEPTDDKERALWVELKRLFKPNTDDTLWKLQRYVLDPLKWRLYDTCGVHHVSTERGIDIFMRVEKDYPLSKGVLTLMLVNRLLVEQHSEMENELLRKIFIQANRPR